MSDSYLDLLMAQQGEVSESADGEGGIWVVVDVIDGAVAPVTLEALGAARTLADSLGAYVQAVLLGEGVADLVQVLYQAGADGVRLADHASLAQFALEPTMAVLDGLFQEGKPEIVFLGATEMGRELAGRLAQRLGGGLIERITTTNLDEATRAVQAAFPIYGGEYFEIAACPEARPQFFTVEPGAFPPPFLDTFRQGEATEVAVEPVEPAVRVIGEAEGFEPPAVPLRQALVVVAAGRQAGDFELVEKLAVALNGQVAGDRGALDAGWIGLEQVVDARGAIIAPEVYVAVGIQGDTFHNAAIEEAKFILAIHPDPQAPIFQLADLCLEGQPSEILPALLGLLG